MHLLCWDALGNSQLAELRPRRVLSISGVAGDADLYIASMGQVALYVTLEKMSDVAVSLLITPSSPKRPARGSVLKLLPGIPAKAVGLSWMITLSRPEAGLASAAREDQGRSISPPRSKTYERLMEWAACSMEDSGVLPARLKEFLFLVQGEASARSGILVLTEARGPKLVACAGMEANEAETLWEGLPAHAIEQVVKSRATVILPENLRECGVKATTVFLKGLKSMIGFPVLAERRLLAVFFLGFNNPFTEFSAELQSTLQHGAGLLGLILQRALLREQLSSGAGVSRSGWCADTSQHLLVGTSTALQLVYREIYKLAATQIPILIQGETGSGKELAAREIHRLSRRSAAAFVALNAAALPDSLVESELFGHKKGAFTGAVADRSGLIEQAQGGTLFIDEVAEMPLAIQAKLLRVLQEKSVTRLGENQARPVDFRLITATHTDLQNLIRARSFREDLFFRIAGARIQLPPLRSRREDILTLANLFLGSFAAEYGLASKEWSVEAMQALRSAPWPGNVRELRSTVERALILADGAVIGVDDLGLMHASASGETRCADLPNVTSAAPSFPEKTLSQECDMGRPPDDVRTTERLQHSKEDWLRRQVVDALTACRGNKTEAAKRLGVGRRTLFRYVEQLGIDEGARP